MVMQTVTETLRIPVVATVDVVVCGGGPSGIGAAIAAARQGVSVLLVERYGFLGGMWTAGLVTNMLDTDHKGGLVVEILERLAGKNALGGHTNTMFDPEVMKLILDEMTEESQVRVLLHALAVRPIMDGDVIKGVIVETKGGTLAIHSSVVIDCTGDADVAYRAGVPCQLGRQEDNYTQAMTLSMQLSGVKYIRKTPGQGKELGRMVKEAIAKGAKYTGVFDEPRIGNLYPGHGLLGWSHVGGNATDPWELTQAEKEGRRQNYDAYRFCREHLPGFEEIKLVQTGPQIGVRETRHIKGEYWLTREDLVEARRFPDTIAICSFPIDIHDETQKRIVSEKVQPYGIPYRCLVPLKVENLLVAGRCVSADHVASASLRVTAPCVIMGQAAGTAAAVAIQKQLTPRQIDTQLLRKRLLDQKVEL